ncbi:hypothetical protein M409DRAFT_69822 [Zasmidium cellare ATCC 36951]|uniref:Peptidase S33 tripeptidyl aminopeptidase-like C-terminal domain-containing protein n=1 Tax=Zasmidium cellare ATCC 36951 TaxID=1080233 RepID=A0A6A6C6I4_ZASCE|nr:uncharacterized protein M409DRAFT_69822 [Zasmidium cellare ATCC 36951]KAF2161492.1 hypothetical protein M409DRAFT_69822 [Zasmidium cellare ATCC 36951]
MSTTSTSLQFSTFDWTTISSANDLNYEKCYEKFDCSRLTVPLDWNNSSSPHNISLAIVRLPAKVPESHPDHGGTIITNPGGPGGSGVQQALQISQRLQNLLDGPKHYEILSFDPRGIFHSKPNAYCFDSAVESEIWYEQKRAAGGLADGEYPLKYNWAAEQARGQLCANTENGRFEDGENIRQHVSTAYVARDMLEIVKKVDQRRTAIFRRDNQFPVKADFSKSTPKLQYVGTSYGTFLGQTFAAMYPEHVGRMLLDANLDPDNWQNRYEASIDDHAQIREIFFETCFAAGSKCAFYREYDKSSDDIRARWESSSEALQRAPTYVTGKGRATPITLDDVRHGFFIATYQPLFFFKKIAKYLNDLMTDVNPGPPFWQLPIPTQESFNDELLINRYMGGEVGPAVHCSDGPYLYDEQLEGFKTYLTNLTERFGWGGAIQADYKISCWTWPASLRTKWRYDGPFNSSVPILFVNNRLDPATPAKNAKKMAASFNGSVFLEQNSAGHGALWPASECMWQHVKKYMVEGKLPPPGTVCEPLCRPFEDKCEDIDAENYWLFG